ncbi:peptidoglycan-binding protein [Agrobacterium sp. rho-13.3]|uniref:peptidoglycan-binding protein n=1 Tax=Agrobacterium sp. rho-13.3 TaxID=3072980 RepID=UPI002A181B75|nr:peptidoglycan-binding protein [Agrobacterium sp. rho-13.3]MDX8310541.1 peptidoglycan-binding protein [Agrobacterium sp. rho-13.3]
MNGLRSNSQQHNDRSSLDALNRTIEGLEARIEDLLGAQAPRSAYDDPSSADRSPVQNRTARPSLKPRFDPVNEIRQRQQALDARWERQQAEAPRANMVAERESERRYAERDYRASTAIPASRPRPTARFERAAPAPTQNANQGDAALREVAEALVSLRQELKHEISEGVAREMQGVRSELRNIRSFAENQDFAEDIREDVARLAASIDRMGASTSPDVEALRSEFEELRVLMDQVAREDSMHRMESRWDNVEDTLRGFDTAPLQEEIVALAYRLDDIKTQLGSMSSSAPVRALEEKLLTIASAVEHLGKHIQPNDGVLTEHFSGLDQRLDEISRAIAAAGNRPAPALDVALTERLENRLDTLSSQIGVLTDAATRKEQPSEALGTRLDALTSRIEELSAERSAAKLGERLDQLSLLLERSQRPSSQPELTSFLTDISRKIDELDTGAVNDKMAERLEKIARRIEQIEAKPAPAKVASYDVAFKRLEDRLSDIATKLDETKAPARVDTNGMSPELDQRMSAIEDYMASSDEYIIEAARQAAEAVLEAHTRNNLSQTASPADMVILTELANDLRKLEGLSRNTEERTHRTFEALHETLVQIAGRLDNLDNRSAPRPASLQPAPTNADHDWAEYDGVRMPAATFPDEGLIANGTKPLFDNEAAREFDNELATETLVPPAAAKAPVEEKRGLLSGLTRRFKSSAAKTEEAPKTDVTARTQIDPAPALDPVDTLQADVENELLEPGSGAPDIKKILERVRASQTAAARAGSNDSDNRADFIAAARRAAQAAAQESVPDKSFAARQPRKGAAEKEGSALSRYRRPLLLGIGAILLAMMAMPAIKSLVGSETTPAAIAVEPAPAEPTAAPMSAPADAQPASVQPAVTEPAELTIDEKAQAAADRMQVDADKQERLIDARAIGGAPLPQDPPALRLPTVPHGNDVAEQLQPLTPNAVIQQDTLRTAETIAVPAGMTPASLGEAAAKGDRLALFEIGARYTDGRGVAADRAEAAKWYKLSADRGLAPAQYRLGNMYEKANGVERNLTEAKRYYQLAADQGNAGAMHNLAVLLASDAAGAPDFKAAGDWFIKASNLGVRDSQFNLAILYARGSGVAQSLEESYKWFAIAARDGDADAGQKRDDVAKAMKPEQLASAKAKVEAWKVTPLNDEANSVNPPAEWVGGEEIKTSSVDMQKAIRNIQAILNNNGFKAGEPDGKLGRNTVTAIKDFQKSIGQNPDGRITDELVTALLARNK